MSISTVQIANFALSKVGADGTIESLTENSAEAKQCNLWIDHSREQTLASFSWSFARVRAILAAHGDEPSEDWGYRYIYPSDSIKARTIVNPIGKEANPIPFKMEQSANGSKSILTDQESAILIYTKNVTTPSLYTPFFIEAFSTTLGSHIAFSLTGKLKLARELSAEAIELSRIAPVMDAVEGQEAPPRDADHTRAR